jgi:peroxiredoxin
VKKAILIIVLIGMVSWAVYDFVVQEEKNELLPDTSGDDTREEVKKEDESNAVINQEDERTAETSEIATVGLDIGDTAPDFQLELLTGKQVKLSDYRGKRVMVNFWATWCPPCQAEMPDMEKFYQSKDVVILAVNLTQTEPNTQQVQDFVNDFNLTFPILLDKKIKVATTYQIRPIPTSFMMDSNGIIQHKAFGPMTYDQMVQEFEKMN